MKRFRFQKLDAFARAGSPGNPAGMVLLDSFDQITPREMLGIARELKGFVSEVGYAARTGKAAFRLMYYSSEREVAFCGHATIAILYQLIRTSEDLLGLEEIRIQTPMGDLAVENRIRAEDSVYITAPPPAFSGRAISVEDTAGALGLDLREIRGDLPVRIVNAGLETLLVPLKGLAATLALAPDEARLKEFCVAKAVDIVVVFSGEVADPRNRYRSRVFAPVFGYLEDPATGSGNAALGSYLLERKMWDGEPISLEQNASFATPNIVRLKAGKDPAAPFRVAFGGGAAVRMDGTYFLHDAAE
ncbi:MAG: PhzF family phenazine biosynthesis protein [Thermodesulfobacteriota bacterium]